MEGGNAGDPAEGRSVSAASISDERIAWAKDEITGWAAAAEQEFCVSRDESAALYAELDGVLALIDELAALRPEGQA